MKTQTEMTLIGLALVVVAVIAWAVLSAGQVDLAAAQVGAQVAAEKLPEAAVIGGQISGWALKTLLGIVAVAMATGLIAWLRQWWRKRKTDKRAWRSGPNANWQTERGTRATSGDELMRMLMMQQMLANNPRRPAAQANLLKDDDFPVEF
jgi:hypothetical protein